jgi:excisionase family DNA binding protein
VPATNTSHREPLVYTIPEAATALRISTARLYELLDSGEIESIQAEDGRKVSAEAVRAYVERGSIVIHRPGVEVVWRPTEWADSRYERLLDLLFPSTIKRKVEG